MSSTINSPNSSDLVTLTEAAEQLGVHYMTAYRYVRTGRMIAEKRAGKWWVRPDDLSRVVAEGTGARRHPSTVDGSPRELMVSPFTDRLVAGDTAGCWDLITDALSAGATPAEVHSRLLRAALERVGDDWSTGVLSVADEHRATSTAYRLIGQLGPLFRHRGRRRGTVVLGSVAGDYHSMPSALLADLLCDRQFDVIDLGANTPNESFIDVANGCDHLVGIGVCVLLDALGAAAMSQIASLRTAMPNTFLVAGGPIVAAASARYVGLVDSVSRTADDACNAFESAMVDSSDRTPRPPKEIDGA